MTVVDDYDDVDNEPDDAGYEVVEGDQESDLPGIEEEAPDPEEDEDDE